jgi:hypothetical protein
MKKPERIGLMFILLTLTFASISNVKAQASTSTENMKTFFDSKIPGIQIQVNATAETLPTENITVVLGMTGIGNVSLEYFNLSIFGFLNGTYKVMMLNMTDANFPLNSTMRKYNCTFTVPEHVWDITYADISLTYRADLGGLELTFPQVTYGFTMTLVKNVYLESIEYQLAHLTDLYQQLQQNYTALQQNLNELDNTRSAVAILAITSIFFLATTLYLVMRKPKNYW